VDEFYETLESEFLSSVLPPYMVELKLDKITIIGTLRNLRPEGLLISQVDDLYHHQKIQLWLQHLLLCCVRPEEIKCETQIHYLNNGLLKFSLPDNPEELLSEWLAAYLQGQQQPLAFFDKTSWAYAEVFYKKEKKGKNDNNEEADKLEELTAAALIAAQKKWDDNYNFAGQNAKPANQYIYRGHVPLNIDFQDLAITLLKPLMEHEVK